MLLEVYESHKPKARATASVAGATATAASVKSIYTNNSRNGASMRASMHLHRITKTDDKHSRFIKDNIPNRFISTCRNGSSCRDTGNASSEANWFCSSF